MKKSQKDKEKNKEIAIKVEGLSKTFRIPHEKDKSLKSAALNSFKKKTFEEFQALNNVSFEIKKGEFFGIIGRNGSGKSTLLKMLAKIYVPDSGTIEINGKISPFLELGVGFNMELTGRENVFLGGSILGLSRQEVAEKFDKIVDFAELREFIDMKMDNYSSGMQVRLAFALAINAHAEILLMDEVLAVGDSNFKDKCMDEFNSYRDKGKTVVLVSHDIGVIQRYCDRVMLLRNGAVQIIGNAHDVAIKYIDQNISYEEERVTSKQKIEEKKTSDKKKKAHALSISFLGQDNKSRKVFRSGESLNVLVRYQLNTKLKNPVFGLAVDNEMKNRVFTTNTEYKELKTGTFEKGVVTVVFKIENILATGSYSFSPAIATESLEILDWKDNMKVLKVMNEKYDSVGVVDLEHQITIKDYKKGGYNA